MLLKLPLQFLAAGIMPPSNFQTGDPALEATVRKYIRENGEAFAEKVQAQQARNAGISIGNAISNAIVETMMNNRGVFGDGEIVIGIDLSGGGRGLSIISAVGDDGTYSSLSQAATDERKALSAQWREARHEAAESGREFDGPERPATGAANAALEDWTQKWLAKFGFETPS